MFNMLKTLRFITNVSINTTRHYRQPRRSVNEGMSKTIQLMRESGYDGEITEESLDMWNESEGNLQHLSELSHMHDKETAGYKEMVRKKIVGRKYFEETSPNFLTWSEKEQIRYLHKDDPKQWSLDRICESFPITKETALKLVKVVWKPSSLQRIARHDASALRNWKELKENTLEGITPELREHLLKFSNRVIPPRNHLDNEKSVRLSLGEVPTGEFSSIITNYQKAIKAKYVKEISSDLSAEKPKYIKSKNIEKEEHKRNKLMLHSEVVPAEDQKENDLIDDTDQRIKQNNMMMYSETFVVNPSSEKAQVSKFKEDERSQSTEIALKIKIPKDVWKKGGTYKVNDCYYDYDGLFLYRVPGMIN